TRCITLIIAVTARPRGITHTREHSGEADGLTDLTVEWDTERDTIRPQEPTRAALPLTALMELAGMPKPIIHARAPRPGHARAQTITVLRGAPRQCAVAMIGSAPQASVAMTAGL